jgi:hypothetical protein
MLSRPVTPQAVGQWLLVLSILYWICKEIIISVRGHRSNSDFGIMADAGTFATSLLLVYGLWDEDVLKAIGDIKLFLVIAGLGSLRYTLKALFS